MAKWSRHLTQQRIISCYTHTMTIVSCPADSGTSLQPTCGLVGMLAADLVRDVDDRGWRDVLASVNSAIQPDTPLVAVILRPRVTQLHKTPPTQRLRARSGVAVQGSVGMAGGQEVTNGV